ncbi:MAG: DNA polymerase III subunit beta [Bacilli bacterium]
MKTAMHVLFNKADLLKIMKDIVRVTPNSTIHQVEKFVRITVDRDTDSVRFETASGDIGLVRTLFDTALGDNPAAIEASGACLLPAKELQEILKRLNGQQVMFKTTTEQTVVITAAKSRFELAGLPLTSFTPYKNPEEGTSACRVQASDLHRLLQATTYAYAKHDEKRLALSGVHIVLNDTGLGTEASDSHRMAKDQIDTDSFSGNAVEAIIPATSLERMAAMLPPRDDDESVELEIGRVGLRATWNDGAAQIMMRGIDAKYPDMTRIVPTQFRLTYTVSRSLLLEACERILILAGEVANQIGQFEFGEDSVDLRAKCPEIGRVEDRIEAIRETGQESLDIAFNVRYLCDAIKAQTTERIWIGLTGARSAAVVKPIDGTGHHLVLPLSMASAAKEESATKTA